MATPRVERPDRIVCGCGAEVAVGRRGPLPERCPACQGARDLMALVDALVGRVPDLAAVEVARVLDRASKRLLRRVGRLRRVR